MDRFVVPYDGGPKAQWCHGPLSQADFESLAAGSGEIDDGLYQELASRLYTVKGGAHFEPFISGGRMVRDGDVVLDAYGGRASVQDGQRPYVYETSRGARSSHGGFLDAPWSSSRDYQLQHAVPEGLAMDDLKKAVDGALAKACFQQEYRDADRYIRHPDDGEASAAYFYEAPYSIGEQMDAELMGSELLPGKKTCAISVRNGGSGPATTINGISARPGTEECGFDGFNPEGAPLFPVSEAEAWRMQSVKDAQKHPMRLIRDTLLNMMRLPHEPVDDMPDKPSLFENLMERHRGLEAEREKQASEKPGKTAMERLKEAGGIAVPSGGAQAEVPDAPEGPA